MKKIEREAEMREFSPQITLTENSREREAECSISLSLSLSLSLFNKFKESEIICNFEIYWLIVECLCA